MQTPWGPTQESTPFGPGIVLHSTAGHGGFKLDAERNAQVPSEWRVESGWYEEDVDALVVAITFPDRFPGHDQEEMKETLEKWGTKGWVAGQYV